MKIPFSLVRFDRIIIVVLVVLALMIGGLALANNLRGAVVMRTIPSEGSMIGAHGQIGIEFGQDMQTAASEAAFSIEPPVAGDFQWDGTTFWFIPRQPLQAGMAYTATLGIGATSNDGRRIRQPINWHFQVRLTEVIYLKLLNGETGEVWSQLAGGGEEQQLTRTDGRVSSFGISADGEWIAYSVGNVDGGIDLWLSDRQGGSSRQLVGCGKAGCSTPAWSPDGKQIAYSHEESEVGNGIENRLPRIWTIEVASGKAAPLYTDDSVSGTDPAWSPDGSRLSFYDLGTSGIRVLELNTCKESIIKTSLQQSGSWSPDGKKILYALPQIVNEILTVSIYQIDLASGENSLELGEDNQGQIDYGLPAWSPDGNWVVVGIRLAGTTESRQLVLTQLDGSKAQQITQTPVYNYAAYQWDPWGTAIIFQRFPQGQSGGEPEVGVWEKANGKITILAQNAAMPAWMP